ncbi:MAG TPA: mycofactocin biosynthesis peptidyl-dipeptidase MftE [Thermoleophilaceae bacterium]
MPNSQETNADPSLDLGQATWPQVAARVRHAVLVPLGSLEQHGPHLPLDTDTRVALAVAQAAAARRGMPVSPPLALGASGEHAAFPGTLSIGTGALTELLVELGRDATSHWGAMLVVNGHGGNLDAVTAAMAQLSAEGRHCGAYHATPRAGDAHAGRTETALLLHLDPSLVRLELAEAGNPRPISELMGRLRREGVRAVSRNGVLGDPRGATAAEGRRLLDELAGACVNALDALLERRA